MAISGKKLQRVMRSYFIAVVRKRAGIELHVNNVQQCEQAATRVLERSFERDLTDEGFGELLLMANRVLGTEVVSLLVDRGSGKPEGDWKSRRLRRAQAGYVDSHDGL